MSQNIAEVLAAVETHGIGEVVIETVGVGQAEYAVRALADVEVLVLMPGAGDYVQAMKAGILETADILAVNKADLPGAERVEAELRAVFERSATPPPVLRVSAESGEGVAALSATIDAALQAAGGKSRREARQRFRVQSLVQRRLREVLDELTPGHWQLPLPELYGVVLGSLRAPGALEGCKQARG
ncbi:MAG: hypothetical protein IT529_00375 [Burkholderiales bacterium]|nr:hypothetical protein [Burkholderiales bacterium]